MDFELHGVHPPFIVSFLGTSPPGAAGLPPSTRLEFAVKLRKARGAPETMKLLTVSLLLIPSAFAQTVSCIPPPAVPPANAAAAPGPGRGPAPRLTPAPQSAA